MVGTKKKPDKRNMLWNFSLEFIAAVEQLNNNNTVRSIATSPLLSMCQLSSAMLLLLLLLRLIGDARSASRLSGPLPLCIYIYIYIQFMRRRHAVIIRRLPATEAPPKRDNTIGSNITGIMAHPRTFRDSLYSTGHCSQDRFTA